MDAASAEILRLAELRSRALVAKDEITLTELLADAFVYTNASGITVGKADYLTFYVRNPELRWEAQELDEVEVQLDADCAVLTARVHDVASAGGERFDRFYRSTYVYVREGGLWRCAAGQSTEAPAP